MNDTQADALLTGLVERYSPSTHEENAVEYLVEQMATLGFRAWRDGVGNAVGELGDGPATLLLLGHIDTVPGNIPVRREGNLLYGRGTVDAKGPLATFVAAAARAGALPNKRIVIVGAVEEEAATSKGARFLLDRYQPDAARPEAVIIGEPSRWNRVTVAYKGRLLVDYTRTDDLSHTAGPETSVCQHAFAFWHAVAEHAAAFNADQPRMFNQLMPSLRSMHSSSDGFTETATLTIGYRLPPGLDSDDLQATLVEFAGDAKLSFRGREVAYRGSKTTSLARAFIQALSAHGQRPQFKVKSGTSDMNVVGPVWQCPILAYGPGDSALDHMPNEHNDLNEYHQAISVLTQVLQILTGFS